MAKEDYSRWIPKAQAAQQLGISERTLERFIAKGQVRRLCQNSPQLVPESSGV